ncbi:hypothetical protein STPYR_12798 [uncultured Stenotrophomonas sp.]|uniref:Uncharacterized protein n=1 Tax=uncultured Stenotrophomonas sp. TaxID=165438 RepID=A0A1Y5Q9D7_9GAMM|nr:hypothetical protein STPYR_12798 [uncultured Stenotrophomonas sp.]
MADEIAYSIGSMTEVSALADTDMLEIERPDGDPLAEPPVPNSWWRVTAAKIATYVLGKVVQGSGMRLSLAGGQLTLESGGAASVEITGSAATLSLEHADRFVRCNNATAQTITIPAQADVAWPDDIQLEGAQWGAGAVTFVAGSGVTLRKRSNRTATTDGQNAPWGLKRTALNEWLLFGDFGSA